MLLEPLQPGATIGIFGGGQLGIYQPWRRPSSGLRPLFYAPEEDVRRSRTSHEFAASYSDEASLIAFAKVCDVITCD